MSAKEKAVATVDKATQALNSTTIGKALLDGGLSLIPGLGAAISSALGSRVFQLSEENSRRFAEKLQSEMEQLGECFHEFVRPVGQLAAQPHDQDQRWRVGRADHFVRDLKAANVNLARLGPVHDGLTARTWQCPTPPLEIASRRARVRRTRRS